MKKTAESISVVQLADARGWTHQKVRRLLEKAGVKITRGRCNIADSEAALTTRGNMATPDEKRFLECELLKLQLKKESGELADVNAVNQHFEKLHSEFVVRIKMWRETLTSKHPSHHAIFDEAFKDLQKMLLELAPYDRHR